MKLDNPTKEPGIYCIENTVNGKRYYGQTVNYKRRFKDHNTKLKSGKHMNQRLQHSYNKHGTEAFIMRLLEKCSLDKLNECEQKYLDMHVGTELCYNISKNVQFTLRGLKASPEKLVKMSASMNFRKKKVHQIDTNNVIVATYESLAEASRQTTIPRPNIIACCGARIKSAGGFNWKYA